MSLSLPPRKVLSRAELDLRWFVTIVLAVALAFVVFAPGYAMAGCKNGPTKLEGTLNLNTATVEQLDLLPGVGPSTADKIVEYRQAHPFKSIRQLMRIKGIGKKTFERLRPYLAVEGETSLHEAADS